MALCEPWPFVSRVAILLLIRKNTITIFNVYVMILYSPPVRFLLLMCFIVSGQCMLPLCPLVLIEVTVLLHLHYSPMRACASIMDLLQTLGLRPHFWFPNRQFFWSGVVNPMLNPPTCQTRSYIYNP